MYINQAHRLTDRDAIFSMIESHPLGAWVCHAEGGLIANQLPFVLDRHRGVDGTLMGHVARANGVWRELGNGTPSVVMFRGPQAYITPNWYPSKTEHGKVVPTWNYAAVNVHGVARVVDDRDGLLALLNRLTRVHESGQPTPWQLADAPKSYIDKLVRAIVGIEITIERIEAKLKASQDEAMPDRLGTVQGLRDTRRDEAIGMADLVRQAIDAEGRPPPQGHRSR